MIRRFLVLCILWITLPVLAHKASDSFLSLKVQGTEVSGQWDIALRDIDFALGLDTDGNGEITWGEVRARHRDITAWSLAALDLDRGGACQLRVDRHAVDTHTDGTYAVLYLQGTCPATTADLVLHYRLLFDLDDLHRGLLRLDLDGLTHGSILSPDNASPSFVAAEVSQLTQFAAFLVQGVWHIWVGFDHILFLLALLLPVVLVREGGRWHGVGRFADALREVLWVITSFTLAHSITLSAAALGWIQLPSRLVESTIALSVVLAAANNLWPLVGGRRWMVAFGFGLIHGFGFASVLAELGLPQATLILSLVGFNLGVETGQLAIVGVFLPAIYLLRNTLFYKRGIFVGGSILTMGIAALWLVERVFDMKFLLF
jgi:hypothetical protein